MLECSAVVKTAAAGEVRLCGTRLPPPRHAASTWIISCSGSHYDTLQSEAPSYLGRGVHIKQAAPARADRVCWVSVHSFPLLSYRRRVITSLESKHFAAVDSASSHTLQRWREAQIWYRGWGQPTRSELDSSSCTLIFFFFFFVIWSNNVCHNLQTID